eukprot:8548835-Pyramimonas_sp.AAC.2
MNRHIAFARSHLHNVCAYDTVTVFGKKCNNFDQYRGLLPETSAETLPSHRVLVAHRQYRGVTTSHRVVDKDRTGHKR